MSKKEPLNIKILKINDGPFTDLKKIDSLRIFEKGGSQNFEKRGLFSTEVFGRVGSEDRQTRMGVVDLKINLIHPIAYRAINELNKLYADIINGNVYVKFNEETKNFDYSTPDEGGRGYEYFMKYFKSIDWGKNDSQHRNKKIEILEKFSMDQLIFKNFPVLPAGLRDYTVKDGKPSEDEINDFYRSILRKASILDNYNLKSSAEAHALDPLRSSMQKTVMDIFGYLETLIYGKTKLIAGKYAKRSIMEGTMNVATPSTSYITDTNSEYKVSYNDTVLGMYQFLKMIMPFFTYAIKTRFLNNIFEQYTNNAKLINPKTLKTEIVAVSNNTRNKWLTRDGLNDILNKLFNKNIMESPVILEGYYLCLLYKKDDIVSVIFNTDILPDNIKEKDLYPITYAELFYLSIQKEAMEKKFPTFVSRYPTAGQGGVYPSRVYLRTTVVSKTIKLVEDLHMPENYSKVYEYPSIGEAYYNTMSAHGTHIARMGMDFDGDKATATAVLTKESIEEIDNLLSSSSYYLDNKNKLAYSAFDNNLNFILGTLGRKRK